MGKIYNILLNSSNISSNKLVDVSGSQLANINYKIDLGVLLSQNVGAYKKSYKLTWGLKSLQHPQANYEPADDIIGMFLKFDGLSQGYNIACDYYGNVINSTFAGLVKWDWNGGDGASNHKFSANTKPDDNPPVYFDNIYNNCFNVNVQFRQLASNNDNNYFSTLFDYVLILSLEEQ